jgi:CheY-like chemotaxis protein
MADQKGIGLNILIVEDEPLIALDIEAAVHALHHIVVGIADTKAGALELAQRAGCDGALIDIRLRDGFTGPEIGEFFRQDLKIPFAFLTGNAEQLPPDRCGALAVIQKPFTQAQIADALASFQVKRSNGLN